MIYYYELAMPFDESPEAAFCPIYYHLLSRVAFICSILLAPALSIVILIHTVNFQ